MDWKTKMQELEASWTPPVRPEPTPDAPAPESSNDAQPSQHALLTGLDPSHPDTDRAILRRLYHADPERFLNNYGTAGINKLMEIAVKDNAVALHPPITDSAGWAKIVASVERAVAKLPPDELRDVTLPALMLSLVPSAEGDIVALLASLDEMRSTP